jgi:hypothetical protein
MKIDLANPRMGYSLAIAQPRSKDDIWVAPSSTGDQLFDSIRTLYCPVGSKDDENDLPLILTKPEAIRYK